MVLPLLGTAIELANGYRSSARQVNQMVGGEFSNTEQGLKLARHALARIDQCALAYQKGRPKAVWLSAKVDNAQPADLDAQIEATPDTLLRSVAVVHTRRAMAMDALKRDIALGAACLAGLVITSAFFNNTVWGKELVSEMRKVNVLKNLSQLVQRMTANKQAALASGGSLLVLILLATWSGDRESVEAQRAAVALACHDAANQAVGLPGGLRGLEIFSCREGSRKAAHLLEEMAQAN